jgi:hypothetical protein
MFYLWFIYVVLIIAFWVVFHRFFQRIKKNKIKTLLDEILTDEILTDEILIWWFWYISKWIFKDITTIVWSNDHHFNEMILNDK